MKIAASLFTYIDDTAPAVPATPPTLGLGGVAPTPGPGPSPSPTPAPTPTPAPGTFSAVVAQAPSNGATINGIITLTITGAQIYNAELLPANGYTPIYASLVVSADHTSATIQWDSKQVADGQQSFRISAYNTPPNVSTGAVEIIAMEVRTWNVANTGVAPSPTPVPTSQIKVAYYGDGIVLGMNGGTGPTPVTYPLPTLLANAYPGLSVVNKAGEAVSTTNLLNGTGEITTSWTTEIANVNATHIIVNCATEDWAASDQTFADNYRALYNAAHSAGKVFILQTPSPTYQVLSGGASPASDQQVSNRAQIMRNLAVELNTPIIDVFKYINDWLIANGHTYATGVADGLAKADTFALEGLHPDQTGYNKISEVVISRFGTISGITGGSTPAPTPTPTPSGTWPYNRNPSSFSSQGLSDEFNFGTAPNTGTWNYNIWWDSSDPTVNYDLSNGDARIWPKKNGSNSFFRRIFESQTAVSYGYYEWEMLMPSGRGWKVQVGLASPNHHQMAMSFYTDQGPYSNASRHPVTFAASVYDAPTDTFALDALLDGVVNTDLSVARHKYAIEWLPNQINWFFDGVLVHSLSISISDSPMHIFWGGFPDETTPPNGANLIQDSTNSLLVNYVRSWSNVGNNPSTVAGAPSPTPAPTPTPTPSPAGFPSILGPNAANFRSTPSFFDDFNGTQISNKWNLGMWYHAPPPPNTWRVNNGYFEMCLQPGSMFTGANDTAYVAIDTDPVNGNGQGNFAQKYGCFQIRAKIAAGKGAWSAFWLFGHPSGFRPEIDIFETYPGGSGDWTIGSNPPKPNRADLSIHCKDDADNDLASGFNQHLIDSTDLSASFHTYTLEWDQNFMKTYVDGILKNTCTQSDTMAYFSQFPLYIVLDLGVNYGVAGGPSNNSSVTPTGFGNGTPSAPAANVFSIDYCAAWQYNKY